MPEGKPLHETIESSIRGLVLFLGNLLATWTVGLVRPDYLGRARESSFHTWIPPFSLLTISVFLYAIIVGPYFALEPPGGSSLFQINAWPEATRVARDAFVQIQQATLTNVLSIALPTLLFLCAAIYALVQLAIRNPVRQPALVALLRGFALQLFLAVLLQIWFMSSLSINEVPLFNFPYFALSAYSVAIPWIALMAVEWPAQHDLQVWKRLLRALLLMVVIIGISVGEVQAMGFQQFITRHYLTLPSNVTVKLLNYMHGRYDNTGKMLLFAFVTVNNSSGSDRLYNPDLSFMTFNHEGNTGMPYFGVWSDLHGRPFPIVVVPAKTNVTFMVRVPINDNPFDIPPWQDSGMVDVSNFTANIGMEPVDGKDPMRSDSIKFTLALDSGP